MGRQCAVDALVDVLQALGFGASVEVLSPIIRKTAHVMMYAVLGALTVWAFAAHRQMTKGLVVGSVVLAFAYAISDEVHQAFVPGRSAEVRDVLIDTVGAGAGASLMGWVLVRRQDDLQDRKNLIQ